MLLNKKLYLVIVCIKKIFGTSCRTVSERILIFKTDKLYEEIKLTKKKKNYTNRKVLEFSSNDKKVI